MYVNNPNGSHGIPWTRGVLIPPPCVTNSQTLISLARPITYPFLALPVRLSFSRVLLTISPRLSDRGTQIKFGGDSYDRLFSPSSSLVIKTPIVPPPNMAFGILKVAHVA